MTYQEMFENAKKSLMKAKKVDASSHIAVQFNVTGEGSGIFYVEAAEGKLHVEPYTYDDRDAVLTADSAVLLEALKTANTADLQMEGSEEKIAAFRTILESLPKPRKTAGRKPAAAAADKKAAPAGRKPRAAKAEPAAKAAAAKTAEKKAAPAEPKAAKKAAPEKKPAAKKTTKK